LLRGCYTDCWYNYNRCLRGLPPIETDDSIGGDGRIDPLICEVEWIDCRRDCRR